MTLGKTLDDWMRVVNREESGEKAKWLKVADGKSVSLRFLQELSADGKNYDTDYGTALLVQEVSDPKNFMRKCVSTIDTEQRCFGIEMHMKHKGQDGYNGGWRPKNRMYVNVLVDDGEDAPYVAIMSQGTGPKSILPTLLSYAAEEGTITDTVFKLSRTGSGSQDTQWTLIPTKRTEPAFDADKHVLYNLDETAVRHVPYAEQAAYFGYADSEDSDESTSAKIDW